jgi:hypothetical protein
MLSTTLNALHNVGQGYANVIGFVMDVLFSSFVRSETGFALAVNRVGFPRCPLQDSPGIDLYRSASQVHCSFKAPGPVDR